MRNASSPGGAWHRLIGRGSSRPGASSMKNWPGIPGSSPPRSSRRSEYGPIALAAEHGETLAAAALPPGHCVTSASRRWPTRRQTSIPIRSWSDSADSARAFAIACTAAAAPEIVVTHGTRATSAASRMR